MWQKWHAWWHQWRMTIITVSLEKVWQKWHHNLLSLFLAWIIYSPKFLTNDLTISKFSLIILRRTLKTIPMNGQVFFNNIASNSKNNPVNSSYNSEFYIFSYIGSIPTYIAEKKDLQILKEELLFGYKIFNGFADNPLSYFKCPLRRFKKLLSNLEIYVKPLN